MGIAMHVNRQKAENLYMRELESEIYCYAHHNKIFSWTRDRTRRRVGGGRGWWW
jgi:hypothetical protein